MFDVDYEETIKELCKKVTRLLLDEITLMKIDIAEGNAIILTVISVLLSLNCITQSLMGGSLEDSEELFNMVVDQSRQTMLANKSGLIKKYSN